MIVDLRERQQHLPTLAQWHHQEWAYLNPGRTLEQRIADMACYLGDTFVPTTYVWEENGEVLGSAAIDNEDMDSHPEYWPWLVSVFVKPQRRGEGIGAALVRHVMAQAWQNGIIKLHLFTPDQEKFYRNLGWQVLNHEPYFGKTVTIMYATPDREGA